MKYCAVGLLSIGLLSCNIEDDNDRLIPFVPSEVENPVTISQIAIATPELSLFEEALRRLENESNFKVLSELNIPGSTTVFAPSDDAFNAFLTDNGIDGIENVPRVALENIIQNHILDGETLSSGFTTGYIKTNSVNNNSDVNIDLFVDTTNGVLLNGNTSVVTPDVSANNGVIHVIDRVLRVPTVFDLLSLNPSFTSLVDAIRVADAGIEDTDATEPVEDILGALGTELTFFAPNNAALANLLTALEVSSLSEVSPTVLRNVLLTHIINRNSLFTTNLETDTFRSRNRRTLSVNADDLTVTDPNGTIANIVTSGTVNIQTDNGVFQEIDAVLQP